MKKLNRPIKKQTVLYWTEERLKTEAVNYSGMVEFRKKSPYAYAAVKEKHLEKLVKKYFYDAGIKIIEPEFLFRKPKAVTIKDKKTMIAHRYFNQIKSYLKEGEKLNYFFDDFKAYIDKKMQNGMTWFNFGTVWEIDHKRPRINFKLNDPPGPIHYALDNLVPTFIKS